MQKRREEYDEPSPRCYQLLDAHKVNFGRKACLLFRSSGESRRAARRGKSSFSRSAGPPGGRKPMKSRMILAMMGSLVVAAMFCLDLRPVHAGETPSASGYKVLEPIQHGSLTVFPVVAPKSYSTAEFLTLDEGLRSGEVVVTEYGNVRGLMRRRPVPAVQRESAEVNRLVLINNSKRPLLLLAGEIVTGGKQDRVIGKDRIVPAESDPVDLSVFCVEPGRWVAANGKADFGMVPGSTGGLLASPVVRSKAMAAKNQQQ